MANKKSRTICCQFTPQILSSDWPVEIKASERYRLETIESRHSCQEKSVFTFGEELFAGPVRWYRLAFHHFPKRNSSRIRSQMSNLEQVNLTQLVHL